MSANSSHEPKKIAAHTKTTYEQKISSHHLLNFTRFLSHVFKRTHVTKFHTSFATALKLYQETQMGYGANRKNIKELKVYDITNWTRRQNFNT